MENQIPENNNVVEETPVTETPVTETPVTETPVTETPVEETPVTEASENDKIKVSKEEIVNAVKNPSKVFGIISLVCGILAQVCCCCCGGVSIPFSIAAIVLAIVDKSKNDKFSGLSIAGLILGIAGIALFIVSLFINATSSLLPSLMSEF